MTRTVRAPAKINLYLGVGPRREDGFHPLATVYQAIGLYDDVTVADAPNWTVTTTADDHIDLTTVPADDDNIAVRAGRALAAHHGLDRAAAISVHKGIPVAAGLAGGSADAAATLVALDRLWDLQTSDSDLLRIAAMIGSDVPFSLLGGSARGHGRGELVTPVPDSGAWWWVVVGHAGGLSTPVVYQAFDDAARDASIHEPEIPNDLLTALAAGDPDALVAAWGNDLQGPALGLRPELRDTVTDSVDAGALSVLLAGSGPTLLLLARNADHAREVAGAMAEHGHERIWVAPGPVAGAHLVTYV